MYIVFSPIDGNVNKKKLKKKNNTMNFKLTQMVLNFKKINK